MKGTHDHTTNRASVGDALDMAVTLRVQLDAYLGDAAWPTPREQREDTRGILNPDDFIAWMHARA